jgi:hypothetical protein
LEPGDDPGLPNAGGEVVSLERPCPERIRLVVDAAGGAWVVHAETFFPGWRAWIRDFDDAEPREVPIEAAYGILQAVRLPLDTTGPVEVVLEYAPRGWTCGKIATAIGLSFMLLLVVLHHGRRW